MTIDLDVFDLGRRRDLGTHHFSADAIIAFARKYDPQIFHIDEKAARESIYGGLCASGWHTASVSMRKNVDYWSVWRAELEDRGDSMPDLGPSPGFRNLRWPKAVYAGDTIRYHKTFTSVRHRRSNPDWGILEAHIEAFNDNGDPVMTLDSSVLVRL